jgi:biotin synthase
VVQVSTLLSIKGGCPEDCGYCPQAARYHTSVEGNDLMSVSQVKLRLCEQNQVGLQSMYGSSLEKRKDGPEFDQVLRWFVPSTNWRWKYAALLV